MKRTYRPSLMVSLTIAVGVLTYPIAVAACLNRPTEAKLAQWVVIYTAIMAIAAVVGEIFDLYSKRKTSKPVEVGCSFVLIVVTLAILELMFLAAIAPVGTGFYL